MNETCSFVSRLTWKEFLFFIWTTTATAIWQLWPCAVTDENKNVISLFLFRFAADGEYSRTDRELFDLNLEKILFTAKFNVTLLREKHLRSFLSVMLFFLFVCVSCTHYLFIMLLGIICCCYIFMLIFIIIYLFFSIRFKSGHFSLFPVVSFSARWQERTMCETFYFTCWIKCFIWIVI